MLTPEDAGESAAEFMEKYGDLTFAALGRQAKILEARAAVLEAAKAILEAAKEIGEELKPPPRRDETLGEVIKRAAANGNREAQLLIKSGALNLTDFSLCLVPNNPHGI